MDDIRIKFLERFTLKSLKIKQDKWQEFIASNEPNRVISSFFENPDWDSLVISRNEEGHLVASLVFPRSLKKKAVYFVKKGNEIIKEDNIQSLYVGDVDRSPVEVMRGVVEEVIYPLQTNEKNMKKCPKIVSEDVAHYTQKLRSEMFVLEGHLKGKILLPLPENVYVSDNRKPSSLDSKVLHAIETSIIDWVHQVAEVLNTNSAQPILDGLNPLPKVEFDFWDNRLFLLECIHEQLMDKKASKMAQVLETAESAYWPILKNIYKDVEEGLKEARNITIYLKPLKEKLDKIEQLDYTSLPSYTGAVVHTVALIWANSEYYHHPERVIVILQEICNLFIDMTRNFLGSDEVMNRLQEATEEMLEKIGISIVTLVQLKNAYEQCKLDMDKYFKDGKTLNWEFPSYLVFKRLDEFLQRLKKIEEVYSCSVEFLKLKHIETLSVKRGALGSLILHIYEEFVELIQMFANCKYDPLNTNDKSYDRDLQKFQSQITDYEIRIGTIFCQAFNNCATHELAVKVLDMFGGILERPQIQSQISSKYKELVNMFSLQLDKSKLLYDAQMATMEMTHGFSTIAQTMPHVAGKLKWAQEMQDRIKKPMKSFKAIHHSCMKTDEAKLVFQKYDEIMDLLNNYSQKVYSQWTAQIDTECECSLNQLLLLRNSKINTFTVNFKKLLAIQKEVKYLKIQGWEVIPPCAAEIFTKYANFEKYVGSLDLLVCWFNQIKGKVLPVELPLIGQELDSINEKLAYAESSLCWNSEGVLEYVLDMCTILHDFQSRIETTKSNVKTLHDIMNEWAATPIFQRKDNKKELLLDLDIRELAAEKKYDSIKESGEKIIALVEENMNLFKADEMSDSWIKYVEYIDDEILDGFFKVVRLSLSFLVDNMHAEAEYPLFEVLFELEDNVTSFNPSLDTMETNDFLSLVKELIDDVYKTATAIPRLLATAEIGYQEELEHHYQLTEIRESILNQVLIALNMASYYRKGLDNYADLWEDDREEFMEQFLIYGRVLTEEEIEDNIDEEIPQNPPTLVEFKEMINTYENLFTKVENLQNMKVLQAWFQIDISPFKHALLNIIKRWSWMFKKHLIDRVTNSLKELEDFITEIKLGISKTIKENDYGGLVALMEHLMRLKERQVAIDTMFQPLMDTIELLREYGEDFPNKVHEQLQDLPDHWKNLKKMALQVKQDVGPLQAIEVKKILKKCHHFQIRVFTFQKQFQQKPVFDFSVKNPYQALDKAQNAIAKLEAEMSGLCRSASLFEVKPPDDKQFVVCQKEIVLLKELWNMIHLVKGTMDHWKRTPWKDINVDEIEVSTKRFSKDIKGLDKEMKAMEAFTPLDNMVNKMIMSLQTVRDFQNSDQLWLQVKAEMSEETTFKDLLNILNTFKDKDLDTVESTENNLDQL